MDRPMNNYVWKSNDQQQLETLQKIHELIYNIKRDQTTTKDHLTKISNAQVTQMSVIISLLGKLVNKFDLLIERIDSYAPDATS